MYYNEIKMNCEHRIVRIIGEELENSRINFSVRISVIESDTKYSSCVRSECIRYYLAQNNERE